MKRLIKNGSVINVFTGQLENVNVLIENDKIIGVGSYSDEDADSVTDAKGKYICPGFIDGHIHIESTMLTPAEFAKVCVPHGTTSVVADPHEIANVCGSAGIRYMLEAGENIPLSVYIMLPSCVPATPFCESGAVLEASDLKELYNHPRVLGLGEVMNYVGVINENEGLLQKIEDAHSFGLTVNGHAPLLSGRELDRYISKGINDDHECSSAEEAKERIRKGQRVMIRQGTAAKNLEALLPLFDEPWAHRCLLVTDDKHPADLLSEGHIDGIIRLAVQSGKSAITGIRMATLWAAECFNLKYIGAIAPGYKADILILDDLDSVSVSEVYRNGICVARGGKMLESKAPEIRPDIDKAIRNSFYMDKLCAEDFKLGYKSVRQCRVIVLIKNELLTEEKIMDVDFDKYNGIDIERDIVKIAVAERHLNTGHKGIGFITGTGLKCGAIASSVSHDSHNLIIIGTNEEDMATAANRLRQLGGGCIVVKCGEIISEMPLPLAGLMTELPAAEIAKQNEAVRKSVHTLGAPEDIELFMTMAFVSLPVIPHLKITTRGLIDVDSQKTVPLLYKGISKNLS